VATVLLHPPAQAQTSEPRGTADSSRGNNDAAIVVHCSNAGDPDVASALAYWSACASTHGQAGDLGSVRLAFE
jgi:hypothetical protein